MSITGTGVSPYACSGCSSGYECTMQGCNLMFAYTGLISHLVTDTSMIHQSVMIDKYCNVHKADPILSIASKTPANKGIGWFYVGHCCSCVISANSFNQLAHHFEP